MASVSWRIRWSGMSCIPSRHQYNEEVESEEDQGMTKMFMEWSKYWSSRIWAYDKYVLKRKMEWPIICTFKTSSWSRMKKWRASSRWASRRDHMLEACHPHGDHWYMKTCPKKKLSHKSMGEQFASLQQASSLICEDMTKEESFP